MAIVFPLTWPDLPVQEIDLIMVTTSAMNESPFTGQQQVYSWPRQMWRADIVLPKMPREKAEQWICFLAKLRGRVGTFLMPPIVGNVQRGSMTGSPLVDGAGQTGLELSINGMTANSSGVFLAGDFLQLGSGSTARLHKVLNDADADATGSATLDIWPPLRSAPADGATIVFTNPAGIFRLNQSESPFKYVSPQRASLRFSVIEDI
ncbi:MAG: hypothetical protein L3J57_01630 [Desulfuromusa sp.]|nr:hypothetical protein [Desulfuromusa sp.]